MKTRQWVFITLFLIPSLCFGAAVDYKVDNLGNVSSHTLGIKAGTGDFYTWFQGGTQVGTVTYTLPNSSSTGLLLNTTGTWSWATDIPTATTIGTAYIYRVGGTDVSVADGGTGVSTFALNGVLYGNAANAIGVTAIGAEGQMLRVGASPFVPAWTTATYPGIATTTGAYLRADGTNWISSTLILPNAGTAYKLAAYTTTNTLTELVAVGATGEYLAGATGAIPAWATLNQAAVTGLTTASGPTFAHLHISDLAAITTAAESWVGPSSTAGVYFKGGFSGVGTTSPLVRWHVSQPSDANYPTLGTTKGGFILDIAGNNLYGFFMGVEANSGNVWQQVMRNDAATAYNLLLQPVGGYVGIGTTGPVTLLSLGNQGVLSLMEDAAHGTNYIGHIAPHSVGTTVTYTWPEVTGTAGYVLACAADGTLSWVDNAAGTGMSNPMLAVGDLIYASVAGTPATPAHLHIGTAGQVLETYDSGAGVMLPRWGAGGGLAVGGDGTPAGQIQFETAGGLDGDDEFYWDTTNKEIYAIGTKTGTKRLYLRNTSNGTGSDSGINIGNDTAADQLTLRINSSAFTTYGGYSYLWSKANAPMLFGVNNTEVMRLSPYILTLNNEIHITGSSQANIKMSDTGGDTDEKNWLWYVNGENMYLSTYDDTWSYGATVFSITRDGFTPTAINYYQGIQLKLYGTYPYYNSFKTSTSQSTSIDYTLPTALGAAGTYLTDAAGNGVLSWATTTTTFLALTDTPSSYSGQALKYARVNAAENALEFAAVSVMGYPGAGIAVSTGSAWGTSLASIIAQGGSVLNPTTAINVVVWRAPYSCTVTNVRGYRVGGSGATINARRNGTSNHLSSDLSVTSADAWTDGGAVQNTAFVAGDKLEIMVVTQTGNPTQVAIQVDFTRP